MEKIAMLLISASENSALCDDHHEEMKIRRINKNPKNEECLDCYAANNDFDECSLHKVELQPDQDCEKCSNFQKLVKDFQTHKHTFSCQKKNKLINIKKEEGHGRYDGHIEGPKISNYVHCRFNFPQFPMNRTTFIPGIPKSLDESALLERKKDLLKIKKYIIRQTYSENPSQESENFKYLKTLSFAQFLYEVGMFDVDRKLEKYSIKEKVKAYERYINALSASIKGTGSIFLKRTTKDLFTNNYNRRLMEVHKANHDIQMVVDQVKYFIKCKFSLLRVHIFSMPVHNMLWATS